MYISLQTCNRGLYTLLPTMSNAPESIYQLSDEFFLCPLYTPAVELLWIHWITEDCEVETNHLVSRSTCCMLPPNPDPTIDRHLSVYTVRPFLYMIVGQISRRDCRLTTEGYGDRAVRPIASCWIKPCARDQISRLEWAASACTIRRIMETVHAPSSTDALVARGRPLRIQLFHEPHIGQVCTSFPLHMLPLKLVLKSIEESLPMYGTDGRHCVPTSLSEVPFGCSMRFLFTIHIWHDWLLPDECRLLYGRLQLMRRL